MKKTETHETQTFTIPIKRWRVTLAYLPNGTGVFPTIEVEGLLLFYSKGEMSILGFAEGDLRVVKQIYNVQSWERIL